MAVGDRFTGGALGVLPILFLAQIAFIVAFGVLLDTFLVRSLLVPALAYDIGPKIWWPSKLSRNDVGENELAASESADYPVDNVATLDALREEISTALGTPDAARWLTISVTGDRKWIA